ncbi:GbsR/MarR family transcriptional regulator [Streptomyces axinellae]|uniref:GbsR/MarR family transcriptional regulator n=1 Tax=Streptomyces axinellae TaxID=552788 RepID=UPI0031CDD92A
MPGEPDEEETRRHYDENVSPFVERFAADLTEAGMQRMASRVFACLLASEEGALTSAELSERLQASPAAISGAVRYLAQVNMISRQRDRGSRRERYLLHHDVWYSTLLNRDNLLTRWQTTLRTGARTLGKDTPGGRRVNESAEFLSFLQSELEALLKRWHESRDAAPGRPAPAPERGPRS